MTETATADSAEKERTEIQLPADLVDLEVSMFRNAFSVLEPRPVKIVSLLSAIQGGFYKDRIKRLRGLKNNREAYDSAKKELPAVTLSGTFSKRNESCLTRYSGLIQLDFDHVPDPEKLRVTQFFRVGNMIEIKLNQSRITGQAGFISLRKSP